MASWEWMFSTIYVCRVGCKPSAQPPKHVSTSSWMLWWWWWWWSVPGVYWQLSSLYSVHRTIQQCIYTGASHNSAFSKLDASVHRHRAARATPKTSISVMPAAVLTRVSSARYHLMTHRCQPLQVLPRMMSHGDGRRPTFPASQINSVLCFHYLCTQGDALMLLGTIQPEVDNIVTNGRETTKISCLRSLVYWNNVIQRYLIIEQYTAIRMSSYLTNSAVIFTWALHNHYR